MDIYILLYFKWITKKDLLYSTWNSSQYYVAPWMGGVSVGERIHVYMYTSGSLHFSPETITTLSVKRLYLNTK